MRATPSAETSCSSVRSMFAAGPLSAAPPTIGLIATTGALDSAIA
jgi:hypothetical protein